MQTDYTISIECSSKSAVTPLPLQDPGLTAYLGRHDTNLSTTWGGSLKVINGPLPSPLEKR